MLRNKAATRPTQVPLSDKVLHYDAKRNKVVHDTYKAVVTDTIYMAYTSHTVSIP